MYTSAYQERTSDPIIDGCEPSYGWWESISYNYTAPLVMLACLGVAALVLGLVLKALDAKKHLGLELPNVQNVVEVEESEVETAEQ